MRVLVLFLPELLLMLLAFARLLILSTSLDIDDVFVLLSNWKKNLPPLEDNDDDREEEEHKEFDDDTKNELRLEIVIKGRDFKEEEYAETPLNIYISFLCCFCVSCSSIQKLPSFIFRVLIQFLRLRKKKFSLQNVREKKQTKKTTNIIMVASSSSSLTANALARMLEERPDPQQFQPVLQIAGIVFLRFFIIKRSALSLFFFVFGINSL